MTLDERKLDLILKRKKERKGKKGRKLEMNKCGRDGPMTGRLLLMKIKRGRTTTESLSQPETAGMHILLVWIALRSG